jgi:hypothetical protein
MVTTALAFDSLSLRTTAHVLRLPGTTAVVLFSVRRRTRLRLP